MKSGSIQKSADVSTPAAQPSDSHSEKATGATTAEETGADFDVASALGLQAEGHEPDKKSSKIVDPDQEATKSEEKSDADEEKEETTDEENKSGESDDEESKSDEDSEASGKSDDKESDEEENEADAEKTDEIAEEESEIKPAKSKVAEGTQKRFDELTAARRTAEDEATALREQNATLRASADGEMRARPLDFVDTPAELETARRKLVALHQWALKNEDGGTLEKTEYTREEVAAIRADTYGQINIDLPAREKWLAAKQESDSHAITSYPWLKDTKSGFGRTVLEVVESYPQLRILPNYKLALANMVIAEKFRAAGIPLDDALFTRLAKEKSKQPEKKSGSTETKLPVRRPPPSPGRPGTLPARSTARGAERRAAEQRMEASAGSLDDIAASIAAKLS